MSHPHYNFKVKREIRPMAQQEMNEGQQPNVNVNVNEFRAKFRSKLECYNFMTVDAQC